MKNSISKKKFAILLSSGVLGCALLGVGVGTAAAQIPNLFAPAGLTSADGSSSPAAAPTYAQNSKGLTFGSAAKAISPSTEPDLIEAMTDGGQKGYVKKLDLSAAEGPTNFASPADALAWQAANAGKDVSINVYEVDGVTTIGKFTVHYPTSAEAQSAQTTH
jgi:hypothetical protein